MHLFSPAQADRLESAERYALLQPVETLIRFGLKKGMKFAEIGAGTGFFSRAASEIVGEEGVVYAFDTSKEMLDLLRQRGKPANLRAVKSWEFAVPLQSELIDMSLAAFVLHETSNPKRLVKVLSRITKPGGRIVVIEWKKQVEEHGPPASDRLSEEDLDAALAMYQSKWYKTVEKGELNSSHYFRVLEKLEYHPEGQAASG